MITIAVVLVLVLQVLTAFKVWWKPTPQAPSPALVDACATDAVRQAFMSVGLPADQFSPSFDLQRSGKTQDVLLHAGALLGIDHGLITVGDVVKYLSGKVAIVVLVLMAVCRPATAGDGIFTHIAIASYIAASGADLSTTEYAIGAHKGTEANPAFAPFVGTPWAAGVFKMSVAAGTSWALLKLHKDHPTWAAIAATGGAVFFGAVAAHNSQVSK